MEDGQKVTKIVDGLRVFVCFVFVRGLFFSLVRLDIFSL